MNYRLLLYVQIFYYITFSCYERLLLGKLVTLKNSLGEILSKL